jgi:formylglycine-generating enzyme required for sulfatase activity
VLVALQTAGDADMVLVPAGEFVMGSNDGGDNEKPVHRVYLAAFLIDRHEVTNAQFQRFVQATNYRTTAEQAGSGWVYAGG